jgi:hypothetical protein
MTAYFGKTDAEHMELVLFSVLLIRSGRTFFLHTHTGMKKKKLVRESMKGNSGPEKKFSNRNTCMKTMSLYIFRIKTAEERYSEDSFLGSPRIDSHTNNTSADTVKDYCNHTAYNT